MNIVLDTNVICNDWYLSRVNFGLLEKYLKLNDARLFIPEIVVSETRKKTENYCFCPAFR